MSDDNEIERKRSFDNDGKHVEDVPDVVKKRPRGPSDCLEDDNEEEEFVPFTQESPAVIWSPEKKKVHVKKSVIKGLGSKGIGGKKSSKKSDFAKKKGTAESSGNYNCSNVLGVVHK